MENSKETDQLQFMKIKDLLAFQQQQVQVHSQDMKFKMVQQSHHSYLRGLEALLVQDIQQTDHQLLIFDTVDLQKNHQRQQQHF